MAKGNPLVISPTERVDSGLDPGQVVDTLRYLAADLRSLGKATVLCRILLGRHLIVIQTNELWKRIERRDYRTDPSGEPRWLNTAQRTYTSWYNFIEEGFEHITGLHRQTAYSAIKLAHSNALTVLSHQDLLKFKRLANALELVAAERAGVNITADLLVRAQEMPINAFRHATSRSRGQVLNVRSTPLLSQITRVLKAAVVRDTGALNEFWAILQDAMTTANEDPVGAIEHITSVYFAKRKRVETVREVQAS